MANETQITVVGRLTEDPDIKYTQSNVAVVNIKIASNSRAFDRQSNEWTDKPPTFWKASAWRETAEHIAQTLRKGMEVIVLANVETRPYTDKEGNERSSTELSILAIGPNLRGATAVVTKAQTNQNQQENRQQYQRQGQPQAQQPPQGQQQYQQPVQQQPVQNPGQQEAQGSWLPEQGGSTYNDETPF